MSQKHQHRHGMGPDGNCICPSCNTSIPHQAGSPCKESKCPNCGKAMMREGSEHHKKMIERKDEKR